MCLCWLEGKLGIELFQFKMKPGKLELGHVTINFFGVGGHLGIFNFFFFLLENVNLTMAMFLVLHSVLLYGNGSQVGCKKVMNLVRGIFNVFLF